MTDSIGRIAGITPPKSMQMAARDGLRLFQEYGRGGSKLRIPLATEIAAGAPLAEKDWRKIAGYHARWWGDENPESLIPYPDGGPDAKFIASQLMGGADGFEEATETIPNLNEARRKRVMPQYEG